MHSSGIAGSYGSSICSLLRNLHTVLRGGGISSCKELSWVLCGDLDGWDGGRGVGRRSKREVCVHVCVLSLSSVRLYTYKCS